MKTFLLLSYLSFSSLLYGQEKEYFIGNWKDENKNIIEIYKENNSYYGKIIHSPIKDKEGSILLLQMVQRNEKILYGGTIYDNIKKNEYEAKLKLKDTNTIILTIKYGFCNKKSTWYRNLERL